MKMNAWILVFGLLATAPVFAGSTIQIDEKTQTAETQFSGIQGHDVYKDVYVSQTCTREVLDGYQTVCHDVHDTVCETHGSVRACHPITRRECDEVPIYRTEVYDCSYWTTVKVGFEVDYHLDVQVEATVKMPEGAKPSETIHFDTDNYSSYVEMEASETSARYLIFAKKTQDSEVTGNEQKTVKVKVEITLIDVSDVKASFAAGLQDANLTTEKVSFRMPKNPISNLVKVELNLRRHRFMWFSKKLYNDRVSNEALSILPEEKTELFVIDLNKLALKEKFKAGKEYKFELTVTLNRGQLENCLNSRDLPKDLELEAKEKHVKL